MKWLSNISRKRLEEKPEWLINKVIDEPRATDCYSVEELKKKGMVGVYSDLNFPSNIIIPNKGKQALTEPES